jgi:hypothetical protein
MVTCKKTKVPNLPANENEEEKTPLDVKDPILKDTSAYLFEFTRKLMPLQKLHQMVDVNYLMSDLNNDLQEVAVYGNHPTKLFDIKYEDFWKFREEKYKGCEIINGYMYLLEETYTNIGKKQILCSPIL